MKKRSAVQFSIFNYKLKNENWNASFWDHVNRSSIKDDGNWLTLNLQWIQAAAHKEMSMLLNRPCMLLNKPYRFHWSQERFTSGFECVIEKYGWEQIVYFLLLGAANRVDKTLRISQVTTERLAMAFKVSTILWICYFWFKIPSLSIK